MVVIFMIRIAIVDDDELVCKELEHYISEYDLKYEYDLKCDSYIECENLLKSLENGIEYKLIFLDIEMPLINGFDLLDGLKTKPQIIFITSKADYAVKAFDYEATDFLQKPISKERFNKAVKKATELHALRYENHEDHGESIVIKSNLKKLKVYVSKIKWIEA